MKLEFLSQVMVNFKAFTGHHRVTWNSVGVTLLLGVNQLDPELIANGAGKSTIFDAWSWCLFGRTPRNVRNPGVAPWGKAIGWKDNGTMVGLEINIDGVPHKIERRTDPNRLLWDGEDIDQEKLEAKIGMNFELATNTVLLPQGRPLFFDRTPEQKMDLFTETLGTERWDERSKKAAERRDEAEAKLHKLAIERAGELTALEEVTAELKRARIDAEQWELQSSKNKRTLQEDIKQLEKQLEQAELRYGNAKLAEDSAGTELKALRAESSKLLDDFRAAARGVDQAKLAIEHAERQARICMQELASLRKSKVCPTCGQPVKPSNLVEHMAELQNKRDEYEEIIRTGTPKQLIALVENNKKRAELINKHLAEFEAKEDKARSEVALYMPAVLRLTADVKNMRKQLQDSSTNPHHDRIRRLQERDKKINEFLKSIAKDLALAQVQIERAKIWVRGFKDIKLQLINDVLGELQLVTNAMLISVGLSGWQVRYDIEKELKSGDTKRVFNVEIASTASKGFVRWESWSGGESERLKLIGALALSDVLLAKAGVETNLEILDEPAKYWSAPSVESLSAFLAERARQTGKSIYLVEHQAAESSHFANTLTVIKDAKGAYIAKD
jgi:DNA repair exonuclease SbcCD ATPase subunit